MSFGRSGFGSGHRRMGVRLGPAGGAVGVPTLNFIAGANSGGVSASVVRSTSANVNTATGALSSIAANTARLSADEILNTPSGILIEGGISNIIPSPDFSGATVGVLGSGGSLPTGWVFDQGSNALTFTVTSVNPLAFTITGTPTSTTVIYLWVTGAGNSGINISPNTSQSYILSSWLQQISTTGLSFLNSTIWEFDTTGTFLRATALQYNDPVNTDKPWPIQQAFTVGASTVYVRPAIWDWVAINGTPINASFVIDRPQMEVSAFRSTYQPSATRASDVVTVNSAANYIGNAPWTIDLTFRHPRYNGTYTLAEAKLDANNRIELYSLANVLMAKVVSAGVTLTNTVVGQLPIVTTSHATLSVSPTGIAVSLNGKPAKTAALTPPSGLTSLQLGGGTDGFINSTVGIVKLYPSALSSAQVAVTSSGGVSFYDDFDRANGAPGTAPTGQTYIQTTNSQGAQITQSTITSKKLVTADSGQSTTAAYTTVALAATPRLVSGAVTFSTGTTGGSNVFLVGQNDFTTLGIITASHIVNSDASNGFAYIASGSFTSLASYPYVTAIPRDGATLNNWASAALSNGTNINVEPDGRLTRLVSAALTANLGPYVSYEHFWSAGNTQPSFSAISAEI